MSATTCIFLAGLVLCVWATLRNLGNEREQKVRRLELQIKAEQDAETAAAVAAATAALAKTAGANAASRVQIPKIPSTKPAAKAA